MSAGGTSPYSGSARPLQRLIYGLLSNDSVSGVTNFTVMSARTKSTGILLHLLQATFRLSIINIKFLRCKNSYQFNSVHFVHNKYIATYMRFATNIKGSGLDSLTLISQLQQIAN
jgi:hypothetical protein